MVTFIVSLNLLRRAGAIHCHPLSPHEHVLFTNGEGPLLCAAELNPF